MDILDVLRDRLTTLIASRSAAQAELEAVLELPATEARDLNDAEANAFAEARSRVEQLDADIAATRGRVEQIESTRSTAVAHQAAVDTRTDPAERPTAPVRVTAEPAAYQRGGASFFADLHQRSQNPDAAERLARHARETRGLETRASSTSNFAGFVVPQYLVDLYTPYLRQGRSFANAVNTSISLPPSGMTINLTRITTPTTTGVQSSENSALSNQDIDDTLLAVSVRTVGGYVDVSRQAVDRGEMVDEIVVQDLAASYAYSIESHIINHGTDGVLSITPLGVTYTDASPTVAELYPKVADGIQQIASKRFMPAEVIVMHPRRWGWLTAALDSQSRPLVVPNAHGPMNAAGVATGPTDVTYVGSLQGLPVLTSAAVPTNLGGGTNEDRVIVARASDMLLMEEPNAPMRVRVDEPGAHTLSVRFVGFGYMAFTANRANDGSNAVSAAVISGSGLTTPSF